MGWFWQAGFGVKKGVAAKLYLKHKHTTLHIHTYYTLLYPLLLT